MNKFYHCMTDWVKKIGGKVAVQCEGASLSYLELHYSAIALSLKLKPKDRLLIMGDKSVFSVVLMLACVYSGACFTVLSVEQPVEYIESVMALLEPSQVFLQGKTPKIEHLRKILEEKDLLLDEIALYTVHSQNAFPTVIDEHSPMYIYFTSGSTGQPKGAILSRVAFAESLRLFALDVALSSEDVIINQVELCFDLSLFDLFGGLQAGATIALLNGKDTIHPRAFTETVKQIGGTSLLTVPSYLYYLLNYVAEGMDELPLRQILCSGEPLPASLIKSIFAHTQVKVIWNLYGATEMPYLLAKKMMRDHWNEDEVDIFCNHHATISLESLNGELIVTAPTLLSGYLLPEHTQQKMIIKEGCHWYRTGDRAIFIENDSLKISGRIDRLIKLEGRQVDLDEVERVVENIPEIKEAACVLHEKELVLFYVGSVTEAQLRLLLKNKLPLYMLPRQYVHRGMPFSRTSSGKKNRRALNEK